MLLDQNSELKLRATRPKPLIVSILAHFVLLLILAISPEWFQTEHRRVIRIAGEDFDLSKLQLRQLTLPPRMPQQRAVPAPVPPPAQPPLVQQPPPQQAAPPPPPPPPPPPLQPQPMPDRVIRPDDVLAEGARPDGSPRASRGDTREQARAGTNSPQAGQPSPEEAQEAQKAQEAQRAQDGRQNQQLASNAPNNRPTLPNLNPNALHPPSSLMSDTDRIVEARLAASARSGGRTGLSRGDNNGTFSTEPQILSPNPKGIDFGPYLNQLIDRLRTNWYYVMPEIARLGQRGRVDVVFTVTKTGGVKDLQIVANSGSEPLDKGALSAIQLSNPFQKLPAEYETDLKLRIAFLYNLNP